MVAYNRSMRRFLCFVLTTFVAVGFAACGATNSTSGQGGTAGVGGGTAATGGATSSSAGGSAGAGGCGNVEQVAGDCKKNVCDGGDVTSTPDDTDVPDDGNDCT